MDRPKWKKCRRKCLVDALPILGEAVTKYSLSHEKGCQRDKVPDASIETAEPRYSLDMHTRKFSIESENFAVHNKTTG